MKITNRFGVPQTLVNLMERDTYSRGSCHISVTQLIDAPRIKILKERHADDIVQDVSDSLWSLVGKAMHHIAEGGADAQHLAEERLFADILGWRISGGIDLQITGAERCALSDYKFTSVWAATQNKPEWERQLNVYSWLVRVNKGWATDGLSITALLRDWNRRDARKDRDYPQAPIKVFPVKLWSFEEQQAYVEGRIRLHQEAWRLEEWEEELPLCLPEERWAKPDTYAVIKHGGKRATAVFDNEPEAQQYVAGNDTVYRIDLRPGAAIRCGDYCQASNWCNQFQSERNGVLDDM